MIPATERMIISSTEYWLKNLIIAHHLCPFAGAVVNNNQIRYCVNYDSDTTERLISLITECRLLDQSNNIETSLFICANGLEQFDDYLDFLELMNQLLITHNYEGIYQIASFHPQYCFAETDPDDSSNYTNRSPYPMIHILREASIEQALASYPNPENIPDKNIALTRQLGNDKLRALLHACFQLEK